MFWLGLAIFFALFFLWAINWHVAEISKDQKRSTDAQEVTNQVLVRIAEALESISDRGTPDI